MPFDTALMQKFIDDHQSQYVGKYRFHSGYRSGDYSFKNRYYMFDENFRQIDIYAEINLKDGVTYTFSEDLHQLEKEFIVKDALNRIIERTKYTTGLHYSLYENLTSSEIEQHLSFEPMDYCDIYKYMKYYKGVSQKCVDDFYSLYIPTLKSLVSRGFYKKAIDSIYVLLDNILYEHSWDGTTSRYLDCEYQYHLYYVREIIRMVYSDLDKFYNNVSEDIIRVIELLCRHDRFSLAIMTDFGNLVLSHYLITCDIMKVLKDKFALLDEEKTDKYLSLSYLYIHYIFHSDYDHYHEAVLRILRTVVNNMLTYANSDLDLALGNAFIKSDGYEILLDLFHQDYNTYVFNCYSIDLFPYELQEKIKKELVGAIQFFAARMQNEKYKQSSFDQVMNINRLLMNNYKEWYK